MLADHVKQHGRYPEKVSFVIWGDKTMRHEGVLESQIFYLLGAKPVWDDARRSSTSTIVPTSSGSNVPASTSSLRRRLKACFSNVTLLMDKAVQKVKALEEVDNFIATPATCKPKPC